MKTSSFTLALFGINDEHSITLYEEEVIETINELSFGENKFFQHRMGEFDDTEILFLTLGVSRFMTGHIRKNLIIKE